MADGEEKIREIELQPWTQRTRAQSEALAAYAARALESAAAQREQAERMLERMTEQSEHLNAALSTAWQGAATAPPKDHLYEPAKGRDGILSPRGRGEEPRAATLSAMDTYLRGIAAVRERESVGVEVLDAVIQEFSVIGLNLAGAAGLAMVPEARMRIEGIADVLDDVIRAIRSAIFMEQHLLDCP